MAGEEQPPRAWWHPRTLVGVIHPGRRQADAKLRRYGVVTVVVIGLLAANRESQRSLVETLRADRVEERQLRAEQHVATVHALNAIAGGLEATKSALQTMDQKRDDRLADMRATIEWIKGSVSGKLRCPPCPGCPTCPQTTVQVLPATPPPPSPPARSPDPRRMGTP